MTRAFVYSNRRRSVAHDGVVLIVICLGHRYLELKAGGEFWLSSVDDYAEPTSWLDWEEL